MKNIKKITDLLPDTNNFNKHSPFGMGLLEKSMQQHGFMEAGVISEDGVIISGNARQETAVNIGLEDIQIIDTDGKRAIYLRATGVNSGTKEFSELALKLNATAKANIIFDAQLVEAELGEAICEEWGIQKYIDEEVKEDEDLGAVSKLQVIIECSSINEQKDTYDEMIAQGYTVKSIQF